MTSQVYSYYVNDRQTLYKWKNMFFGITFVCSDLEIIELYDTNTHHLGVL